jgi:uncharacterized membrane protein YecN with MAPEG domain
MTDAVMSAAITGGFAVLTTFLTVKSGYKDVMSEIEKHQAVQDEKIENLTTEVRKHNDFASRFPVLEERVSHLEKGP